jgi:hypothetical protein
MTNGTAVLEEACSNSSRSQDVVANPGGLFPLVMLSAWCGLVAGLLEVGVIILRKRMLDSDHLYKMSRHLVWLIPSINLTIFLLLGVVLSAFVWCWRLRGPWLAPRLLCALTLLPPIWAASLGIYCPAGFILALGFASRLVPALERNVSGFRRLVRVSFPLVAGLVPILAALSLGIRSEEGVGRGDATAPADGLPQCPLDRA